MKNKLLLIITAFTLISFPKVNFGQAPDLGTTSGFALFTADGAFDNDGVTSVTGDIGTNAGAFTGFPIPGTVDGQIYVEDAISLQAAIDVNSVYSYLNAITCDSVIETTLGSGQVLTPKVYCMEAASTLNGNLTLDGQGNSDALFIFQIDGALLISAFSNVILINSASLCNVYWQINGALELGDGSVFRGTIIANGAINLLESSSLFGRGLSIAGAITLHNNTVVLGTTPLPIELLSFTIRQADVDVEFYWSTASETNNNYFTVQRSKDAISFEEVLRIHGAANSNTVLHYSAIDYNPYNGTSYYRLKQTDFDGKFTYSNIVAIDFVSQLTDYVNIYPNPFSTSITIMMNDASQTNNCEFRIYNAMGIEVVNTTITKPLTTFETSNFSSGTYLYKVIDNNKTIQSGKLISQQ